MLYKYRYQLGDFNLAIENQLKRLKFIEISKYNQHEQESFDLNYTIANCYVELEKFNLALEYYKTCVEIQNSTSVVVKETDESLYTYEHVGNFYYENENYDLAIDCYNKGLNILQPDNDQDSSIHVADFNYKIGCYYQIQQKTDLFIEYFQKS